jgi:hypothetical protein
MPPAVMMMLFMSMVSYPIMMRQVRNLVFGPGFDAEELRTWTKDAIKRVAAEAADEPAE